MSNTNRTGDRRIVQRVVTAVQDVHPSVLPFLKSLQGPFVYIYINFIENLYFQRLITIVKIIYSILIFQ